MPRPGRTSRGRRSRRVRRIGQIAARRESPMSITFPLCDCSSCRGESQPPRQALIYDLYDVLVVDSLTTYIGRDGNMYRRLVQYLCIAELPYQLVVADP